MVAEDFDAVTWDRKVPKRMDLTLAVTSCSNPGR